jgi:hypothetical protein
MAAITYDLIASQTLGSAASSITFSSIAASWTDLRLVIVPTGSVANDVQLTFNGDTASNYSRTYLYGTGAAAGSFSGANTAFIYLDGAGVSTTIPHLYTADIFSYAGSTYKTLLYTGSEANNNSGQTLRGVGLWRSTAAITSIGLATGGGNFSIGTTASLYGIKAA